MTQTTINVMKKKPIIQIEKGTWVKKNGEFFVVSKVSEAQFNEVVDQALFNPRYNQIGSGIGGSQIGSVERQYQSPFHVGHIGSVSTSRPVAQREPLNAKYVLINVSTGMKFYPEFLILTELLMRLTNAGFEVVEKVTITESF